MKTVQTHNTPPLETARLRLRRFTPDDLDALFLLYSDREVNRFLPWFPLSTRAEAQELLERDYLACYQQPQGYRYAICPREENVPIGYVHVSLSEGFDLGYALRPDFWHRGLAVEACAAVLQLLREDGLPYVTATHDVNNPRSGAVMRRLGMRYRYSYREQWQPKNYPVVLRLYQCNLDGQEERVYTRYRERTDCWFVEPGL